MRRNFSKNRGINTSVLSCVCIGILLLIFAVPVCGDEAVQTAYYEVRSNIENASVFFDGTFAGTIHEGSLIVPAETSNRPVRHELSIQADGYITYNETIVQAPKPGESNIIRGTLTRLPPPQTGTLNLAVSPPGGEVFLDTTPMGVVDQSGIFTLMDVEAGYRNLQIRLAGYEDWYNRVYVEANMITRVRVTLTPVTTGSLQVTSEPSSANVMINGAPAGITPVTIPDLSLGTVAIRLTLPGYQDWSAETSVIPGQTVPVSASLAPLVVHTPEPVNQTPAATMTPEPTQAPAGLLSVMSALGILLVARRIR